MRMERPLLKEIGQGESIINISRQPEGQKFDNGEFQGGITSHRVSLYLHYRTNIKIGYVKFVNYITTREDIRRQKITAQ